MKHTEQKATPNMQTRTTMIEGRKCRRNAEHSRYWDCLDQNNRPIYTGTKAEIRKALKRAKQPNLH